MDTVSKILSMSFGGYSLDQILSAIITFVICLLAVKLVMRAVEKLIARTKHVNDRLQRVTLNVVKTLLYLLTVIITAGALGVNTTSLTAIASVLTLGVTLASQDIMSNVAGGLIILSTHPFALGDVIEADGTVGTVREISLNYTKIETADGQIVLQPNHTLSSTKITNYTTLGRRRIAIKVGASYDTPTDTVKAACLDAVHSTAGILEAPEADVILSGYGESAIEYTVRCWANVADYWPAYNTLNEKLRESFAKFGAEMPYNHLNVHMISK
jgi:small conductance mechanosensitive channel